MNKTRKRCWFCEVQLHIHFDGYIEKNKNEFLINYFQTSKKNFLKIYVMEFVRIFNHVIRIYRRIHRIQMPYHNMFVMVILKCVLS